MEATTEKYLPSASNSITARVAIANRPGMLAKVTSVIGEKGGNIGAIDIVRAETDELTRDITINTRSDEHAQSIVQEIREIEGVEVVNLSDRTFLLHLSGKLEVESKSPLQTRDQLSMAYTPGVARVSESIHETPSDAHRLTIKSNTVAVVSDGTAVLGLGDIGPKAAIPVMEGKAQLLKEFAGVNGFPVCLDTTSVDEIVDTVRRIAPVFGGINLEDIAAPRCFAIEERLKDELDVPVFHDDQHGTAVVTVAALLNALTVVDKDLADISVVMAGIGAAGTAVTEMLLQMGVEDIVGVDRSGPVTEERGDLTAAKKRYVEMTEPSTDGDTLSEVMEGADVFIGLSAPDIIDVEDLKGMARDPVVFAMANPQPEIRPEVAYPHVAVMATGRSDYPNQINNVLCFPGLFKGLLDCRAAAITGEMKVAAAEAIADTIDDQNLTSDYIIPSVFDKEVVSRVSAAVSQAAHEQNVARKRT
ncbi:MAG: NAD-dependent malic enzyme [Bacteroidetes bacterium QH_7_64_110]|jgi:malate dehydrogenase (oxaloacetate-decarboxylating)|nr:MAG: NAD-dependent malic enzyme [Bacteroidetes bacterium QH_1_64_81]PSQ73966.1 MAG: NAD-dependent malic enzyme [Bacteroidetes bacterium QH_6_64_77]PSQ74600.1 MAG: NAD-dependent malic enzyme [Bacteroidetes bacterium QH_7_64_110]